MASGRAAPGFRPEKIGTKPCTSLTQIIIHIQDKREIISANPRHLRE